ncbi:hypothetical protein PVK06_003790 [Gossypium arboreum]|uniref:Uncharacterized protein n=1 Tax=Gossypium arboreum TaxID=29729 RepID=A0ABR0QQL3_GOSAR|nr:hypothetical protein PVK06_003790 [Gossypium arboreum]
MTDLHGLLKWLFGSTKICLYFLPSYLELLLHQKGRECNWLRPIPSLESAYPSLSVSLRDLSALVSRISTKVSPKACLPVNRKHLVNVTFKQKLRQRLEKVLSFRFDTQAWRISSSSWTDSS